MDQAPYCLTNLTGPDAMPPDLREQTDADSKAGYLRARPQSIEKPRGGMSGVQALGLGSGRDGTILVPTRFDDSKPAPLILALHGAGGVAAQVMNIFNQHAEARGIVILAPESRSSTWDIVRGGYGPDVAFIERALRKVFQQYAIDPNRLAIAGFSDGASYALSLGLTNGNLFSDILAFSPGFMAPARQADTPRIFVSHGVRDDVLPIDSCSRRLVPLLKQAGYMVEYHEFLDGHIIPADMVQRAIDRFLN
jgi:phospholipase/carboxylesterase